MTKQMPRIHTLATVDLASLRAATGGSDISMTTKTPTTGSTPTRTIGLIGSPTTPTTTTQPQIAPV